MERQASPGRKADAECVVHLFFTREGHEGFELRPWERDGRPTCFVVPIATAR